MHTVPQNSTSSLNESRMLVGGSYFHCCTYFLEVSLSLTCLCKARFAIQYEGTWWTMSGDPGLRNGVKQLLS